MSNTHGATCLHGLLTTEKVQSVLRTGSFEAMRPDHFAGASLANRRSFSTTIERIAENEWLYDEIMSLFTAFNHGYNLDIDAVEEPLQLIQYRLGGCIDWHVDSQPHDSAKVRKLSLSIQLSPADKYVGGDIEFAAQPHDPFARALGSVVCFPSYCAHRVTPITEGERFSLVAFAAGPAFR
jgi:predicted 2-oxoglutarate/Fe(II)-dependent dioxygenase YbiX